MQDTWGAHHLTDDQLFGCTPLRPPVYSTPEVRGKADTTLVGEVDMSLTQGVLI